MEKSGNGPIRALGIPGMGKNLGFIQGKLGWISREFDGIPGSWNLWNHGMMEFSGWWNSRFTESPNSWIAENSRILEKKIRNDRITEFRDCGIYGILGFIESWNSGIMELLKSWNSTITEFWDREISGILEFRDFWNPGIPGSRN